MKMKKLCVITATFFLISVMLPAQAVTTTTPNQAQIASDPTVFTTPQGSPATSSAGIHPFEINDNITLIDEKSLFFYASLGIHSDPGGDATNGVRFYSFVLKPKEKMSLRLKAEDSNRVGMEFMSPAKTDPMAREFARLNFMPKVLRSSRMDIKNITDQPYMLVLMAYGRINHWYKIEIKRSM